MRVLRAQALALLLPVMWLIVPDARNNLNQATAEASRLKTVADNALNTAKNKRKEAIDAVPVATQAEKNIRICSKALKASL